MCSTTSFQEGVTPSKLPLQDMTALNSCSDIWQALAVRQTYHSPSCVIMCVLLQSYSILLFDLLQQILSAVFPFQFLLFCFCFFLREGEGEELFKNIHHTYNRCWLSNMSGSNGKLCTKGFALLEWPYPLHLLLYASSTRNQSWSSSYPQSEELWGHGWLEKEQAWQGGELTESELSVDKGLVS